MRKEYKMTEHVYQRHANACAPGADASKPAGHDNSVIDKAWEHLGAEIGFDWRTVQEVKGKTDRYFSAIPLTLKQRDAAYAEIGIASNLADDEANRPQAVMVGDLKIMMEQPKEGEAAPKYYSKERLLVIEFKTQQSLDEALKTGGVMFRPIRNDTA